jgi:hypothetical protein
MTLNSLFRKAIEKLEIIAAGEDVEPEDQAFFASKYVSLYGLLSGMRLVSWGPDDPIPDEMEIPLVNMLAWVCASEYGEDQNRFAIEGSVGLPTPSLAERQLRQMLAVAYVSTPAESEYL